MINSISCLGYRGFSTKETLNLAIPNGKPGSGLTILVGPNGGGNSTLVECFHQLSLTKAYNNSVSFSRGTRGNAINTLMAAAAYNMRHWMNKHATSLFVSWLLALARRLKNTIFEHENQYACERSRLVIVAGWGFSRLDYLDYEQNQHRTYCS